MAKGTLVFEFESALDLENQMRAYLRMPPLKEVGLGEVEQAPDTARGVLGKPGDGMSSSTLARREQEENDRRLEHAAKTGTPFAPYGAGDHGGGAATAAHNAPAMAGKTAITEEVRKANQEAAEAALKLREPVVEKAEPAKEEPKAVPEATPAPVITLETLADAPYPELLAFCEHTPAVGVDASKCQATFFRKLVEMKIKTYLETK